jgi:hypothetical protein
VSFFLHKCFEITCPLFLYNVFPVITGGYHGKIFLKRIFNEVFTYNEIPTHPRLCIAQGLIPGKVAAVALGFTYH